MRHHRCGRAPERAKPHASLGSRVKSDPFEFSRPAILLSVQWLQRHLAVNTASIAAAASLYMTGMTWEYVSGVRAIVECRSISETGFTCTPWMSRIVAAVYRRSC